MTGAASTAFSSSHQKDKFAVYLVHRLYCRLDYRSARDSLHGQPSSVRTHGDNRTRRYETKNQHELACVLTPKTPHPHLDRHKTGTASTAFIFSPQEKKDKQHPIEKNLTQ